MLGFGLLFLSLTVISGVANRLFGAIGFLAVVVAGALASAASSSVLVGQQLGRGQVAGSSAAIAMFLTFWDLEELLVSLEAFDLLRTEGEETRTVYRLTPNGHKIVAEQGKSPRAITATAVKVLTTAVTRLHAPADAWVEQAREEELIGTGGSHQVRSSLCRARGEQRAHTCVDARGSRSARASA